MIIISTTLAAWLGSMFVYSAGLKLVWYDRAGSIVKPYRILPPRIGSAVGFLLPWMELLAGMLLLLGLIFPLGPLLGATLGASFAYAAFHVLRRGADISCGCTGGTKDRVNRTTLIRAVFITASSLFLLGTGLLESVSLPLLVVVPLVFASLVSAGIALYHRIRTAQWQQLREQHLQAELDRARFVLTGPLVAPNFDH